MDAMTHAIEAYVSTEWSAHGEPFCLQALRLIRDNLPEAASGSAGEEARGNMLIAASLAIVPGAAGNFALGATHSMSHAAGGHYGVPHGVANAINLPHVVRFNAAGEEWIGERYRDIAELLGADASGSPSDVGDALAGWIAELTRSLGLPQRLSEAGVPEAGMEKLIEAAMGDGSTLVNPRELEEDDFRVLFEAAL
jgi:alcohol dehydrogenase